MYRGTFKKGIISRTQGQRKWHVSQIDEETLDDIRFQLHQTMELKGWRLSDHLRKKKNLTFSDEIVQHVIDAGSIIEYNETPIKSRKSRRVLLRDSRDKHKVITNLGLTESNLCVVIDIDCGDVVTAFWNDANDNHKTIDMRQYENAPLKFT